MSIYGSNYNLVKALEERKLFKISDGLYSNEKNPKEIEVFLKKHSSVVFTMESALYYLGISDVIPNKYVVATNKDSTKIKDGNVIQYFMNRSIVNFGVINIVRNGVSIPLYSKERMLIEVARYKNKLPYDYYKEVINYYREHINDIDISLVIDYLESFPKKEYIKRIIQTEVL